MKFPKNLGDGVSGLARSKAQFLDQIDVPFLKHRLPGGAYAEKKGEFLYAHAAVEEEAYPPLLAVYRVDDTTPANARLKTRASQRTVADSMPPMQLVEGEAKPMPASSVYVGGGYVLRLMFADRHNEVPGVSAGSAYIWPVLHRVGNADAEVLSLSPDNLPGANISFADVARFEVLFQYVYGNGSVNRRSSEPERWPSIYAMGHDGTSFKFGMLMGGQAEGDLAFVGDTSSRRMVGAPLGFDFTGELIQWWQVRAWAVGRGQVIALLPPAPTAGSLPPPNPPRLLRTDDFGASWSLDPLEELLPILSYYVISEGVDEGQMRFLVDGAVGYRTFIAQPMGGGRIGIVVRGGADTLYPNGNTAGRIRWMFFISDETGRNFVRKAWPLDAIAPDSQQGMLERHPFESNAPFATDPVPSFWQTERELSCQHMSAGPGSFFFSMSTELDATLQRTWMISTRDFGDSWQVSGDLPQAALSVFPSGTKPGRFPQATPSVMRARASDAAPGLLSLSSVALGGTVRVFRTTARFESFEAAPEVTVPGLAPEVPANREPYCSKPVFVGTRSTGRTFIHPGFPGMFDRA